MKGIQFVVPGRPGGKETPRVFVHERTGRHTAMTPWRTRSKEGHVRECFCKAVTALREPQGHPGTGVPGWEPWEGPVVVIVEAWFQIPASWPKWRREATLLKPWAPRSPDADNILKLVCDALSGVAYVDDRQVVDAWVLKFYGTGASCLKVELGFVDGVPRVRATAKRSESNGGVVRG